MTLVGPNGAPLRREFDRSYLTKTFATYRPNDVYAWSLERIKAARTAHLSGQFASSEALAVGMNTDARIFAGRLNRIAPALGLPRKIVGGASDAARAEAERTFIRSYNAIARGTLAQLFDTHAMLGIAVFQNIWTIREDGSRIDVRLEPWPMSSVTWYEHTRQLMAQTTDGLVPIVHGDGKWVVVAARAEKPWQVGAIVPLCITWPDRAFGIRDRSRHAEAHGKAKPIGTLPQGIETGSKEGDALLEAMRRLHEAEGMMLAPHGSEVKYLESMSQAWQIYREILSSGGGDVMSVLLGQEGAASATGGNYVKDSILFGVRNDIVEADVGTAGRALGEGMLGPWEIVNLGGGDVPLTIEWLMPDADEDARRESLAKRTAAFNADVKAYRENGFVVDQALVTALAKQYGVIAPTLAAAA